MAEQGADGDVATTGNNVEYGISISDAVLVEAEKVSKTCPLEEIRGFLRVL